MTDVLESSSVPPESPVDLSDSTVRRVFMALSAPLGAIVFSFVAATALLYVAGSDPFAAYGDMLSHASKLEVQVSMINRATPLYISGVAAAIGFKMNLFNIGVEGQYRMAAIFAAYVGGAVALPGVLHIGLIIIVAMLVGAAWSGLAGVLHTHRGVNEVIATIMLNGVALGIIAWLVRKWQAEGNLAQVGVGTERIDESGIMPTLSWLPETIFRDLKGTGELTGVVVIAIAVGIFYYVLLNRTVFGFDLQASGSNPLASRFGGIPPRRMALTAMLLSGGIAGLVGIAEIMDKGRYNPNFVGFLGFNGIGIALLGRNHPGGIAVGALLWAFLEASSDILQTSGNAPKEIIDIMRGVILLTVVIGYEVVSRIRKRDEATRAAARLSGGAA